LQIDKDNIIKKTLAPTQYIIHKGSRGLQRSENIFKFVVAGYGLGSEPLRIIYSPLAGIIRWSILNDF